MSILDLDAMLGQSLAATEAAPDYVTLENGDYILVVQEAKASKKEVSDKPKAIKENKPTEYVALELTYAVESIIEQEGQPIKPGSLTSERFTLSEQGLPYFKARVRDIAVASGAYAEDVDGLSIGEALAAVKSLTFRTSAKQNKRIVNGNEMVNVRYNNIRSPEAAE